MRFLSVGAGRLGLSLILCSCVPPTVAQEKVLKGSLGADLEALWGDKGTVWEFEKKDSMARVVRLHFRKPRGGEVMRGALTRGVAPRSFEYSLAERGGKRFIELGIFASGKDPERSLTLSYKLDGDKLQILEGKDLELDLKGTWKLVSSSTLEKVLFVEPFNDELGKGWSWVREDAKAWRLDKGALVLRTLPGHLRAERNNSKNVLLRPLPKSDKPLMVEAYVESEPKAEFEHAGLVWYVDDDNYVSLFQEVLGGKVELQMVTEKDAKPTFAMAKHDAKGVWMGLVISRGKITTKYRRSEKEAWRTVGQSTIPAAGAARVGVMAGGAPKEAERYARFRGFRILEIGG
ncbi:MAG: DUF1349 domain-containing protein [Gemmataceae bacterium]